MAWQTMRQGLRLLKYSTWFRRRAGPLAPRGNRRARVRHLGEIQRVEINAYTGREIGLAFVIVLARHRVQQDEGLRTSCNGYRRNCTRLRCSGTTDCYSRPEKQHEDLKYRVSNRQWRRCHVCSPLRPYCEGRAEEMAAPESSLMRLSLPESRRDGVASMACDASRFNEVVVAAAMS
jgi:hypothetical protein